MLLKLSPPSLNEKRLDLRESQLRFFSFVLLSFAVCCGTQLHRVSAAMPREKRKTRMKGISRNVPVVRYEKEQNKDILMYSKTKTCSTFPGEAFVVTDESRNWFFSVASH